MLTKVVNELMKPYCKVLPLYQYRTSIHALGLTILIFSFMICTLTFNIFISLFIICKPATSANNKW